jgi:hypothetical protein
LARLLFALLVSGGALPAGGPSAVHGFDIVEQDDTTMASSGTHVRASRQVKRVRSARSAYALLEVPLTLAPRCTAAPPQTWMRPRRIPPSDDDDHHQVA